MFNAGLVWRYKTNRPLSEEEKELQLKQRESVDGQPLDQLAVIKINSVYLESVDKYFAWKGWFTLVATVVLVLSVVIAGGVVVGSIDEVRRGGEINYGYLALDVGMLLLMFLPLMWAGLWMLRKDSFRYTHYPIRLNRKNRMVYAFRLDGTVLAAPWDDIYFTLGRENSFVMRGPQFWEIQGHVLDKDKNTVRETFVFHDVESAEIVKRHWEFLRRYMEEGPRELVSRIQHYSPVDQRRETFGEGLRRIFANDSGFLWVQIIAAPVNFLIACGRWIAMRTSKIPQWPADVEAACRIEPSDPYVRDARSNPPAG